MAVIPRGPNTWQIRVELGAGSGGKRKQKTLTFHGTKREAEAEERRLLREIETGMYADPGKLTVGEFLERWLKDSARVACRPMTVETYGSFIEAHLKPQIGHLPLAKLTPLHIQAYYTDRLEKGRIDGNGGLSRRTVLHHHRLLHKALGQAVKWQMLARNPADAVDAPQPEDTERPVLTNLEMATLLKETDGTRLWLPILIAYATGYRRGEILALTWDDADFEARTLRVRRALGYTKEHGLQFQPPKTTAGKRTQRIPVRLVEELRKHKGKQAEERLASADTYQYQGLIVAQDDGQPIRPNDLTVAFARLIRKLEVTPIHFHDLRHGHVTGQLQEGVPLKVVSSRIGHKDAALTLRVYQHILVEMDNEASDAAGRMLGRVMDAEG